MSPVLLLLVVALGSLALWVLAWAARRANTLFVLEVHSGRIVRKAGRIPPRLLRDIADVTARPPVASARIVCISEGGLARVHASGALTEDRIQVLRNLVGQWPIARLKHARKVRSISSVR